MEESVHPRYLLHALGGLEVEGPEGTIRSFGSHRARTLLSYLAHSDRPCYRDDLARVLWPEEPLDVSRPRLRTEIHRLRAALGDAASILSANRDTISIDRSEAALDTEALVELRREAKSEGDKGRRIETFGRAIELLRGPLLPHESEAWCRARRAVWDDIALKTFEEAAGAALDAGLPGEALAWARRGLSQLADRPNLVLLVLQALAALGDLPEALAIYDRYVDRLESESDLKPPQDLVRYAAALRQRRRPDETRPIEFPPANLPPPLGEVFGRDKELSLLKERLIREVGLLNLIGPGGVGKTTLALQTGRALENEFQGRVFFVPLAAVSDEAGLVTAVTQSLLEGNVSGEGVTDIVRLLKGSAALLILDNFEQLVPQGSLWLAQIVSQLTSLRVLVTSRRPVGISAERRMPLHPLPKVLPEAPLADLSNSPAVSLFLDRARRVVPEYLPRAQEMRDIGELSNRLDGMPLALVLVAVHAATVGPRAILRDFGSVGRLVSSSHDVEERHRNLSHTIEWSLGILSPEASTVLRKLLVFPRDWSTEGAVAVAGPDAVDALPSLVDGGLVVIESMPVASRFRMLQLVREHLMREAAPSDLLRDRHAVFYCELIQSVFPKETANIDATIRNLKPEADNIDAALDWLRARNEAAYGRALVGMTAYWCYSQTERRASEWVLTLARETEGREDGLAADLSFSAARLLLIEGRYDEVEERIAVADRLYASLGDRPSSIAALRVRSHLAYYRFDFQTMAEQCERGLVLAEDPEDLSMMAMLLADLSLAQANLGQGDQSLRSIKRCIAIHESRGHVSRVLIAKQSRATTLLSMRRWHDAEAILREVLEASLAGGHDVIEAQCHVHLTTVYLRTNRLEEASASLGKALDPAMPLAHAFARGICHYLGTLLGVLTRDLTVTRRSLDNLFADWSSVATRPAILPAIDMLAFALAAFGYEEIGRRILDEADALRLAKGIDVSPHFMVTYEDARTLLGPPLEVDPPESYEALFRSARKAIWLF